MYFLKLHFFWRYNGGVGCRGKLNGNRHFGQHVKAPGRGLHFTCALLVDFTPVIICLTKMAEYDTYGTGEEGTRCYDGGNVELFVLVLCEGAHGRRGSNRGGLGTMSAAQAAKCAFSEPVITITSPRELTRVLSAHRLWDSRT